MPEKIKVEDIPTPEPDVAVAAPVGDEHVSHLGPILGVLIVVLVLILGGLYLWGRSLVNGPSSELPIIQRVVENSEPETPRAGADAQILRTYSTSDEINAIQADMESTDLDSLDAELFEIERELSAI